MSLLVSIGYYKRIRQITPIGLCSMNWVGSGNLSDFEELLELNYKRLYGWIYDRC